MEDFAIVSMCPDNKVRREVTLHEPLGGVPNSCRRRKKFARRSDGQVRTFFGLSDRDTYRFPVSVVVSVGSASVQPSQRAGALLYGRNPHKHWSFSLGRARVLCYAFDSSWLKRPLLYH